MARRLPLVAAFTLFAGCKNDAPIVCRVAQEKELPKSPLTLLKEASIQKAGDGFVLAGRDGDQLRWAQLGADGTVKGESAIKLPIRALPDAWFGAVAKTATADQMIVAFVAAKGGGLFEIQAVTQDVGGAQSAPKSMMDLPMGTDVDKVRVEMTTTRTGQRAALVVGVEGQAASPSLFVLKSDAEIIGGKPIVAFPKSKAWTCLALVAGRSDFAIADLDPGSDSGFVPVFHLFEFKDDGSRGQGFDLEFDIDRLGCPVVAPSNRGYVLSYQNRDGTFFAEFDLTTSGVNTDLIAGSLRFGGPHKQPSVACVAPMGREYALLFDRPSGHEVWRFDAFGNPHGKSLYLRAAGAAGPVSCWPGLDALYASYLDDTSSYAQGNSPAIPSQRYFIKVDCPSALPIPGSPDASSDRSGN